MGAILGNVTQSQITLVNKIDQPFFGFTVTNATESKFVTISEDIMNITEYVRECMMNQLLINVEYDDATSEVTDVSRGIYL